MKEERPTNPFWTNKRQRGTESTAEAAERAEAPRARKVPHLVTAKELAEFYKVSAPTISTWHREGVIPAAVHVGRVIRFDPEDVADALAKATAKQRKDKRFRRF